jgi:hypothetical protein
MLDVTAETHWKAQPSGQLPRIAVSQPCVGDLDLPPVVDSLVEDAVLVTDAVADGGNLQRRQRSHVARRQTAEAAVAESRLVLGFEDRLQMEAQRRDGLGDPLDELKVEDVVREMRAGETIRTAFSA